MHPTHNPSALFEPTPQQRAQARADLSHLPDPERQTSFALGYLRSALSDAIRHTEHADAGHAIGRCLALLIELDQLQLQQSRYSYDRQDAEDPAWVDPPGIDGYTFTGRGAR
ncbi:hypothetical protein Rhe02_83660 [Rhizocola hellebori]|uniref:Uncharacterized protein n=1 Tax=Rhizocola hellebori TaxID=1392758 RepID=A0A8J3VKB5_9ACTN|nr:hypothetical protein [Rhizocola hellebori]GIH10299.1 hypothetical protein Rhe02_83660 [Rhizocola hellebori]